MKAIETEYKGHRFRSRLEARWAVFFDSTGIRWEYESEGFELSDGSRYLPDFWLPGLCKAGVYVEVKPYGSSSKRARQLAVDSGGPVLLLDGPPAYRVYTFWEVWEGRVVDTGAVFYSKYLPGGSHEDEYRLFVSPGCDDPEWLHQVCPSHAVCSALSARFEHGESG